MNEIPFWMLAANSSFAFSSPILFKKYGVKTHKYIFDSALYIDKKVVVVPLILI